MKIDIVYTWVDGADPAWIARKENTLNKYTTQHSRDASSSARWMDNNELLYSLRSINDYAPWVNNIYIVTDNQIPAWLNRKNPKIHIIDHRDIFPKGTHLPVFNSMAIEANLHHINGLSEHYIYFNDDMFLGNHTSSQNFFTAKGAAIVYVSDIVYAFPNRRRFDLKLNKSKNEYRGAIATNRHLIHKALGKKVYYSFRHSIKSQVKSSLFELEKLFQAEITKTSNTPLRSSDDLLLPNLFAQYGLAQKTAKPKYIKSLKPKPELSDFFYRKHPDLAYAHSELLDENIDAWIGKIKDIRPFTFCISQQNKTNRHALNQTLKFYESYFPNPSPFEMT
jgi:hypothetical protein